MQTIARVFFVGLLAGTGFALLGGADRPTPTLAANKKERIVYLAGGFSDEALIVLSAAVATQPGALLLIDSKPLTPYLRHFLAAYLPDRIIPVGAFPEGKADIERRLGVQVETPIACPATGPPLALWRIVFPRAACVVVCPAQPRSLLLRAGCLAGARGAPLWISSGNRPSSEGAVLTRWLKTWGTREVVFVADDRLSGSMPDLRVTCLKTEEDVENAYERHLAATGRIENAVVANPADRSKDLGGMSVLAPWLAVSKRAALLLTNGKGTDIHKVVTRAAQRRSLSHLDTLILAASLKAVPMLQRPNPIAGDKDPVIDLEPLTPEAQPATAGEAVDRMFTYAIGRLFHEDRAVIPLLLARQVLMAEEASPRRALVVSNPGESLPLLETFSRNTAQELRNAGYKVTGLYGRAVNPRVLRKEMVGKDLFLWEGHHNTLIKDWGFASWDEPLPPTFVFLQSCLALQDYKVQPLLRRGAVGVVGTSTRTYSGSGGALSLAFFDALVYEGQTLGGSLRQAKNFLLAYALLKEKRLGAQAARTGANLRAAWAFTLWGDPTFRLPRPPAPSSALVNVRHEVVGNRVFVDLPSGWHDKVRTAKYQVRMLPNARLAGLVRKGNEEVAGRPLVPLIFAEVHLPRACPGQMPRLRTRLPANNWIFVWDQRRRTGYLLAAPRQCDRTGLRFQVEWCGQTVVDDCVPSKGGSGL
jgi:hypothetical protein